MIGGIPCDVGLLRDAFRWGSEILAFLHRGVE